jgi:type II secretion system protein J
MKKDGFTFIELMVAVVIGAFVTVTAVAAMRGIASAKQTHQHLTELNDEIRYAEQLIRQDLNNLYRSSDFKNAQFELSYLDSDDGIETQSLMFYAVSRKKIRSLQPEGDVYEVQYAIKQNFDTQELFLTRRCCPVVPGVFRNAEDRGWGVLAPVAESIVAMQVRCYNGTEWVDEWNEKRGQFPGLVEVTLLAVGDNENQVLRRSFLINIPRILTKAPVFDSQGQEQTPQNDNSQQNNMENRPPNEGNGGEPQ